MRSILAGAGNRHQHMGGLMSCVVVAVVVGGNSTFFFSSRDLSDNSCMLHVVWNITAPVRFLFSDCCWLSLPAISPWWPPTKERTMLSIPREASRNSTGPRSEPIQKKKKIFPRSFCCKRKLSCSSKYHVKNPNLWKKKRALAVKEEIKERLIQNHHHLWLFDGSTTAHGHRGQW